MPSEQLVEPTLLQEIYANSRTEALGEDDDVGCGGCEALVDTVRHMTVKDIRDILGEEGVKIPSKVRKDGMFELLVSVQKIRQAGESFGAKKDPVDEEDEVESNSTVEKFEEDEEMKDLTAAD